MADRARGRRRIEETWRRRWSLGLADFATEEYVRVGEGARWARPGTLSRNDVAVRVGAAADDFDVGVGVVELDYLGWAPSEWRGGRTQGRLVYACCHYGEGFGEGIVSGYAQGRTVKTPGDQSRSVF